MLKIDNERNPYESSGLIQVCRRDTVAVYGFYSQINIAQHWKDTWNMVIGRSNMLYWWGLSFQKNK